MAYDVRIERQDISALFDLKGRPDALRAHAGAVLPAFPKAPNRKTGRDGVELYHLGPNRWLLRAAAAREADLMADLRAEAAPPDVSVVRVSDTLTFFSITGPDADQAMMVATPLDIHHTYFPQDAVTYTEAFGLKALTTRCAGGFELAVEQSFGDMIADYLARWRGQAEPTRP